MNKEKILESSRRENKNRDLAEMEVTAQAGNSTADKVLHSRYKISLMLHG